MHRILHVIYECIDAVRYIHENDMNISFSKISLEYENKITFLGHNFYILLPIFLLSIQKTKPKPKKKKNQK